MLFLDDALRVYTHTSINQGVHGRPLADYIYSFFSSGFYNDISPLSQISCIAMTILGGMFAVNVFYALLPEKNIPFATWLPLLLSLLPLQYSIVSFRHDSITFGFAILCACLAFWLVASKDGLKYAFLTGLLIFCVLAIYQPMLAIYLCLCCFFLVPGCFTLSWRKIAGFICRSAIGLVTGCILYIPVYLHARRMAFSPFCGLENHPYVAGHSGILKGGNLLKGIIENIGLFLNTVGSYIGPNSVSICIVGGLLFGFIAIVVYKAPLPRKLVAILFACLAFLSCGAYGFLLASPIFLPRTLEALCFFVFCFFLAGMVLGNDLMKKLLGGMAVVCMIVCAFFLASLGNAQRDQATFENAMIIEPLTLDFMELYQKNGPFSFFARNEVPLHFSLGEISREYAYVGQVSGGSFLIMRELSWMKLKYALKEALDPAMEARIKSSRLVVSRLSYDIRDCGEKVYVVILKNDYVPDTVQKFQSD